MLKKLQEMLPQKVRAWIYRVILAAQPIVVYYGLLQEAEAALWVGIIGTALGVALTAINTSTKTEEES